MSLFNLSQVTPFVAIHVGEHIKDELYARNIQQKELAKLTGIQTSILNDIIKGRRDITAEQSILIGKALGLNDDFFYNLQKQYDMDKARLSERVAQQAVAVKIWNVLKLYISENFFKKVGVLSSDIKTDVSTIFKIFGVENLEEFLVLHEKETKITYYKKSDILKTNENDLFSWKYYSIYKSKEKQLLKKFDKNNIYSLCEDLNTIFVVNQDVVKKTGETCENYGIKVLIIDKEGQVPVDGMSFWLGNNPTIVLTLRKKLLDNYAFALMHEIGHIKLHLDNTDKVFVNISEQGVQNAYETEANNFASNMLIPNDKWKLFSAKAKLISPYKIQPYIKDFANNINVNPRILLGRYMFETGFYKIRSSFSNILN